MAELLIGKKKVNPGGEEYSVEDLLTSCNIDDVNYESEIEKDLKFSSDTEESQRKSMEYYQKSFRNFTDSLEVAIKSKDDRDIALGHVRLGICCYRLNMIWQTTYHMDKALQLYYDKITVLGKDIEQLIRFTKILCFKKNQNYPMLNQEIQYFKSMKNIKEAYLLQLKLIEIELLLNRGQLKDASQLFAGINRLQLLDKPLMNDMKSTILSKAELEINYLSIAARVSNSLNKLSESITLLQQAEGLIDEYNLSKDYVEVFSMLGELQLKQGDFQQARGYFEKIKEING